MAVLAGLHFDQQQLSVIIGGGLESACNNLGYYNAVTNTIIADSNTNAALQTAVTTAFDAQHADTRYVAPRTNLALTLGGYSGEFSDARLAACTTTSEAVGLTYAATSNAGAQMPE